MGYEHLIGANRTPPKKKKLDPEMQASYEENIAFTRTLTTVFPGGRKVLDAIRRKCIDCCVGQLAEIENCPCTNCALWTYRRGKNPFHNLAE